MPTIGDRIRARREELGLTQYELGLKLGYKSRATVNKIELGQRNLKQSKIKAIADALDTTPGYIMGWDDETPEPIPQYENIRPIETRRFPIIGAIACGQPIAADERRELYVSAGTDVRADYVLICRGDSMTGSRINDGDIVFIRRQSAVENGQIAAVSIDDDATLKRVYYYPEKDLLILKPSNPAYEDMVYSGEELDHIHILGLAVAFQSDVR